MTRCIGPIAAAVALLAAAAATAAPVGVVDLPAGMLGTAVAVLGQQAGVGIVVADPGLWQRPVRAVKGRMGVAAALQRLAGTDFEAVRLDSRNWRLQRRQRTPAPQRPPVPDAAPAADVDTPIIVTASKRDVRLSAFPGMATIIDGKDLAFGGAGGTDAILSRLATVSSTHLGAGRNKLFIRGIADSSFTGPTQAIVGQYFGDVRLTFNAPDPDLRLYDIASVEVLEGPQATLYGAGSLGGIIRVMRNPPRLAAAAASVSAGVSATAHGAPGGDIGGVLNVPIIADRVAVRLLGYAVDDGGYIDDPLLGRRDVNRVRTVGGRAAVRIEAAPGWTVDVGGTIQHIDGDGSQYADANGPPLTQNARFAQGFAARYGLADIVVNGELGDVRFQSSSGFARQQLFERFDASPAGGAATLFTAANHTVLASNETRFWQPVRNGFGWVVGGSLLYNRTRLNRALGNPANPAPIAGVTNSITEQTLYGEASLEPLRWLSVTAGARFSHARLSGAAEDVAPAFTPDVAAARASVTARRDESRLLPSLGISLTPVPGTILFARYQQGFRPGGLAIADAFVRRFNSDRVSSLEFGIRHGDPQHDTVSASLSVALTDWHNIQADFIDVNGLPATANIGNGRVRSLAARIGWRPFKGLALDIGYAFNDGRVTEPAPAFVFAFALGRQARIPNIARHSLRASADYAAEIADGIDLRAGASVQYIGPSRVGIGPVLGAEQGDYVDSSLTLRVGRPGLGVTLGLTNIADTVGNRFALGAPVGAGSGGQITPLRPRTLRIGLDAAF